LQAWLKWLFGMQKELFQVKFLHQRDAHWQEVSVINQIRKHGPPAVKYNLTGHLFNMDFIGFTRPHYDIWTSHYLNEGNSFTTEAYIPGPLVELGFSLGNNGTLDLKNIGSVDLKSWQYFLTSLPFVESKVTTDKNSRGATLDFYFKIEYLESICHFFPDTLYPLINDYYAGRPHHFYLFFPYCSKEMGYALLQIVNYLYFDYRPFDPVLLDSHVKKLLFWVLNRRKTMAFPKLSRQNQSKILEIGDQLKNNPIRHTNVADLVKTTTTTNMTSFKQSYIEVFNESPFHTINKGVMEKALFLLQSGTYSITEVVQLLNYYNVHQFSRAFKSFYGFTPTEMLTKYQK